MNNVTLGRTIKIFAVAIDILAPLIATLTQFPIWINKSSEAAVSGVFLLLIILSCLPFLKVLKEYFKSPAVWVVWIIMFLLTNLLSSIISEMVIVCFVGMIANCVGAVLYRIGKSIAEKEKEG